MTADETLDWLEAEGRDLTLYERGCAHLFSLSEEQGELEAWRAAAIGLVHQDAVDAAWYDRMIELGRSTDVYPPVAEEPAAGVAAGGAERGERVGEGQKADAGGGDERGAATAR